MFCTSGFTAFLLFLNLYCIFFFFKKKKGKRKVACYSNTLFKLLRLACKFFPPIFLYVMLLILPHPTSWKFGNKQGAASSPDDWVWFLILG